MHEVGIDNTLSAKEYVLTRKLDLLVRNGHGVSTNSRAILFC